MDLYVQRNLSSIKIGLKYGVGASTVCGWLRRYGIDRKDASAAQLVNEPAPEEVDFRDVCARLISIVAVGGHYGRGRWWVRKWMQHYGITIPGRVSAQMGERSHLWKGGRRKHAAGYIQVKRRDHPHAGKDGYVMEHRLVMEAHLGRYLTADEEVHHLDGVKSNNQLENLQVLSVTEHRRLTRLEEAARREAPCKVAEMYPGEYACGNKARHITGLCQGHYFKYHHHRVFLGQVNPARARKPRTTCAASGCPRPLYARGVCEKHHAALVALYPDAVGGTSRP